MIVSTALRQIFAVTGSGAHFDDVKIWAAK